MNKIRLHPIALLLAVNFLAGLFLFRDYGLSWDEPLFYDYAEALGYAYSPHEWFSGNFNLDNAYGASGSDHANRGPAYILLARTPVKLLQSLGLDPASSWHLVNFLFFQFGIYLVYRLSRRWMGIFAALAASAMFAWQPLLWGHAFINPKDPPFLVFFSGAVCFGFEMVDEIANRGPKAVVKIFIAAFFLGIATSIRVLGPLAGLLVCLYGLSLIRKAPASSWITSLFLYASASLIFAFATWPYLWTDPLQKFIAAFGFMSENPTHLQVLFNGQLYRAGELPRRYLPVMLGLTLTEPVWVFFASGVVLAAIRRGREGLFSSALVLAWFFIPFLYVLLRKPPMYDGFRHFLFMLPPIFIFSGFVFERLFFRPRSRIAGLIVLALIFFPSILGIIQLHPYQYAYYNSFIGGLGGAFRKFETDYWLTCYKEAVEEYQSHEPGPARMYVNREAYVAQTYAGEQISIFERRGAGSEIKSGDLILVNTRSNEDLGTYRDAPILLEVGRAGAVFCVIKRIP